MKTKFFVTNVLGPLRHLLHKLPERNVMMILSLFVGISCGLAAVVLKVSIEFIHHHLTSWLPDKAYNYMYLVYPGIGMLIAMLFVKYVIKDNIGEELCGPSPIIYCFTRLLYISSAASFTFATDTPSFFGKQ